MKIRLYLFAVVCLLASAFSSIDAQNLIPNASFEEGAGDDFTNWGKFNGAEFLTATMDPDQVHEGARALVSAGPGYPGEQYRVQLVSDPVATVIGEEYTFTIWAKAATAGGNVRFSTQPNALYGGDTEVTTDWSQLSFTFTANETMTRIALDLGQSAVTYYLDDMEMLAPEDDGGGMNPVAESMTNVMPNPGFEFGDGDDFTNFSKFNGAELLTSSTDDVYAGARALRATVTGMQANAGNPWSAQLVSDPIPTDADQSYTFKVWIKANAEGGQVRFSTNPTDGANQNYSPNFAVGTEWEQIVWTFTAKKDETRFVLDLGERAFTYVVDEMELISSTSLVVANGGFELGPDNEFTNWSKFNGADLFFRETGDVFNGNSALRAEISGNQPNLRSPGLYKLSTTVLIPPSVISIPLAYG